jgi:hypothetical protein
MEFWIFMFVIICHVKVIHGLFIELNISYLNFIVVSPIIFYLSYKLSSLRYSPQTRF